MGPHPDPWPDDPRLDPELFRDGDRRNVVDKYRYWSHEAIVADLDQRRHPFHVAIENWQHDFNIGTIARNANAFLAAGIHIVGKKKWNRRGAMVTDRYQHIQHHPTVADFAAWAGDHDLAVIGIDVVPQARPIEVSELPRALRAAVRPGGPWSFQRSGASRGHDLFDHSIRFNSIDQCWRRLWDRDAHLDSTARAPTRMKPLSATVRLQADMAEVFAVVSDLEAHPRFSADELRVRRLAGSGPGATYESQALSRGKSFDAQLTVITQQPPTAFGFRVEDATGVFHHRFDLARIDDGCQVTHTVTPLRLSAGQKILYWLVLYPVKRPALRQSLDQLNTLF